MTNNPIAEWIAVRNAFRTYSPQGMAISRWPILVSKYAGDSRGEAGGKRFVFAYTNADVDALNRDIRAVRMERGDLGEDHILKTKDGPQMFATGDRIQFTGNARRKSARDAGFTNGVVGTVRNIDGVRMTVETRRQEKRQAAAGCIHGGRQ